MTTLQTSPEAHAETVMEQLLVRGKFPHRPTVENRVAFQWEMEGDLLGTWNGSMKNRITLETLAAAVQDAAPGTPRAVLDVGCAYGNMLLMLNALVGKKQDVRMVGIDLYPESIKYAQAFARVIPGYQNCQYQVADLTAGLPFDENAFDAVNFGDVIEHMTDPAAALREIIRVTRPGGLILISTPLKTGLFKFLARIANRLTGGRVYRRYYAGKSTDLDADGNPVMETAAGHDHVSEMSYRQLRTLLESHGLRIEKCHKMPVMSGSRWFNRHPFLLAFLMGIEAIHSVLKLRSWAHSVIMAVRVPAEKAARS